MRSGLEKPGAIPFLALIVFLLLSLVPSLAGDWSVYIRKNGYIGYHRNEVRPIGADISRIVDDGPVDSRYKVWATNGMCWPWLNEDCRPRPRRAAVDTAFPSTFEVSPILPDDHGPTIYPWKSPSTLTRGVRAFTTYFIQQLDDHQLLPSFSSRSLSPVETAPLRPPSNSADPSIPHLLAPHDDSLRTVHDSNYTKSMTNKTNEKHELQFCDRSSDSWQRVCHAASDFYNQVKVLSATYGVVDSSPLCSNSGPTFSLNSTPSNTPSQLDQQTGVAQPKTLLPNVDSTPTSNLSKSTFHPTIVSEDSQDAGVGRNPKQLRGSCMAIVVGLVVGVMWF